MRDPELLVALLREMAQETDGRIKTINVHLGMSDNEQKRQLHVELLADAGLVEWFEVRKYPRITNAGFDLIEAIDKKKGAWERFKEILETGAPLMIAVNSVTDLFR